MRKTTFEKPALREAYSKVPAEEFKVSLIHDLRTPTIWMSETAKLMLYDIEAGKEIDPERMKKFILTVIEQTNDLFNICEVAVEYSEIQDDKRN